MILVKELQFRKIEEKPWRKKYNANIKMPFVIIILKYPIYIQIKYKTINVIT